MGGVVDSRWEMGTSGFLGQIHTYGRGYTQRWTQGTWLTEATRKIIHNAPEAQNPASPYILDCQHTHTYTHILP